jgi:hypothetical protein
VSGVRLVAFLFRGLYCPPSIGLSSTKKLAVIGRNKRNKTKQQSDAFVMTKQQQRQGQMRGFFAALRMTAGLG